MIGVLGVALLTTTRHLLGQLNNQGLATRALGGIAIALRCPSATHPPLARTYHDLDLITGKHAAHRVSALLTEAGYMPSERFNAVHGHSRMMFTGAEPAHIDLLVDNFVMCHQLRLGRRLDVHGETIGLADLLLTKLQIAELNHKDVVDVVALLADHPLCDDEAGINQAYVVSLLSDDWGWWRTVTANLVLVANMVPTLGLDETRARTVTARLHALEGAIGKGKRSLRWKARARVGERIPWRFDPEEVAL